MAGVPAREWRGPQNPGKVIEAGNSSQRQEPFCDWDAGRFIPGEEAAGEGQRRKGGGVAGRSGEAWLEGSRSVSAENPGCGALS